MKTINRFWQKWYAPYMVAGLLILVTYYLACSRLSEIIVAGVK